VPDRAPSRLSEALLARAFPRLRVLFEDADLLVIEKPAGLSASSGDGDDALGRARAFLGERGDRETYVASHAPLERDASGVLVLLKSRDLNGAFAKLVGEGRMEVVYVAAGEARSGKPRGVEVLERNGARSLVVARGPGKRARAALTASGLVIAGDVERDGPAAPRAMVHAREARFPHPRTGAEIVVHSDVPAALASWVAGSATDRLPKDRAAIERALLDAAERRVGLARSGVTSAFRLVHEAGDAMPGVAIDAYGSHAVLHVSSDEAASREAEMAEVLVSLGFSSVHVKRRPKQANVLVDTRRDEVAPARPIAGAEIEDPIVILERGERFFARRGDGLSTGIFLDQRDNRALVRELSSGASVLNLFAYACAFTVSAALGGATKTTSVDLSKSALAIGEENLRENGVLDLSRHRFVAEDARSFLARAKVRKDRFDLVVLDPPSYATSKGGRFTVEHDFVELAAASMEVLAPGGRLLACTNHRGVHAGKLRRFLTEAAALAGRRIEQLRSLPAPLDFPPPPGGEAHLKTALAWLR
jgi:23S rRNA (cytosine1962-C5)-methyltransferase